MKLEDRNKVMKSYTNIEQSKVLAKILPLESADMVYIKHSSSDNPTWEFNEDFPPMILGKVAINKMTVKTLPCWSLAALISVLPKNNEIEEQHCAPCLFSIKDKWLLKLWYNSNYIITSPIAIFSDNPVDACVEMIIKLHELNLL